MTVPIPPLLPRRTVRAPWPGWTGVRRGPSHDRPTRPQCAGHERERDET